MPITTGKPNTQSTPSTPTTTTTGSHHHDYHQRRTKTVHVVGIVLILSSFGLACFFYNENEEIQRIRQENNADTVIDQPMTMQDRYSIWNHVEDIVDGSRSINININNNNDKTNTRRGSRMKSSSTPSTERKSEQENPLLRPQKALQQYISWHSNSSLALDYKRYGDFIDSNNDLRSFVVGYYSCPIQAGNRLHDFWNALIVAIVTNRTLLWKYYDPETCSYAHVGYDTNPCEISNHERDCAQVLKRAAWIPSYDHWTSISSSTSPDDSSVTPPKVVDRYVLPTLEALGPRNPDYKIGSKMRGFWEPSQETIAKFGGDEEKIRETFTVQDMYPTLSKRYQHRVLQTSREWLMDAQVPFDDMKIALEKPEYANSIILQDLYALGPDFLYGMLFRATFEYQHPALQQNDKRKRGQLSLFQNVDRYSGNDHNGKQYQTPRRGIAQQQKNQHEDDTRLTTIPTIALHVRHPKIAEQGDEAQVEVGQCLDQLWNDMSQQHQLLSPTKTPPQSMSTSTRGESATTTTQTTDSRVVKRTLDSTTTRNNSANTPPCRVYIMTDRVRAVETLTQLVQGKYGCEVITANHNSIDTINRQKALSAFPKNGPQPLIRSVNAGTDGANITRRDHGPFAGLPFFIDLALAGQARHGFIGDCSRSSSQMLHEVIAYDSVMEYFSSSQPTGHHGRTKEGMDAHSLPMSTARTTLTDTFDLSPEQVILERISKQLHTCCLDLQPATLERKEAKLQQRLKEQAWRLQQRKQMHQQN